MGSTTNTGEKTLSPSNDDKTANLDSFVGIWPIVAPINSGKSSFVKGVLTAIDTCRENPLLVCDPNDSLASIMELRQDMLDSTWRETDPTRLGLRHVVLKFFERYEKDRPKTVVFDDLQTYDQKGVETMNLSKFLNANNCLQICVFHELRKFQPVLDQCNRISLDDATFKKFAENNYSRTFYDSETLKEVVAKVRAAFKYSRCRFVTLTRSGGVYAGAELKLV